MYKIGVVGERDAVLGFLSLGMTVRDVNNRDEAAKAIDGMAKDGYGLIFVTETIAKDIDETIARYRNEMLPSIILIPGGQGSLGLGLANIRSNVERAIGVDILSRKEG